MKHFILIAAFLFSACAPISYEDHQHESDALINAYIELEKWCGVPIENNPEADAVIFYRRDQNGKCTAHVAEGK